MVEYGWYFASYLSGIVTVFVLKWIVKLFRGQ